MEETYDLFDKVLGIIRKHTHNGECDLKITFTPDNVAVGDDFLIFSACKEITCTFTRTGSGIILVWFDRDEPMLLENCPNSFFRSIIKNAK